MSKKSKSAKPAKSAAKAPADKGADTGANTGAEAQAQPEAGAFALPYRLHAQYLHDVSFENPGVIKRHEDKNPEPLQYTIHWHIGNKPMEQAGATLYQAELRVTLSAHFGEPDEDKNRCFVLEVSMMAVVEIATNITDKETHQQILRIEVPRLLYPYLRCQIDGLLQEGGYPPMRIPPVNFMQAYQQYTQQQDSAS